MFTTIFITLIIIGVVVLAVQAFQGRWLRLIAGNRLGNISKESARRIGRIISWGISGIVILIGLLLIDFMFHIFGFLIDAILIIGLLCAVFFLVQYMRKWSSTEK